MSRPVIPMLPLLLALGTASAHDDYGIGAVAKFDLDRDGVVTRPEFDQGFEREMTRKMQWLDANEDGVVTADEFRGRHKAEYEARWSAWDADGDGRVSATAMRKREVPVQEGR